ncbi:PHP domain-containing protein [Saliterribacillus persicus]|uniref:Polymerase/histidinol phosphatase N-terminal domain-containing protein n=1 Tax=Saliterribacillus persicus TaxID=930114 RepID=A0A368Y6F0_9BACI|nr:PHP domain-containing protein [Saliterribacillus persicus]RCW74928.1 hypothetical protein DFR57_103225 [Saliterribacillus persicus]
MDLHIHSTFSDGELTPTQIIEEAAKNDLSIISITDHDEIGGYLDAINIARKKGIDLIPGIELNTDGDDGELHILGYHLDPVHPALTAHINWRQKERNQWAQKIINRLHELGYPITFHGAKKWATGEIIVRTHIALELVDQGYFQTQEKAYDSLLKKGADAFIQRASFTAADAIALIHQAGGKAFLAHPGMYKTNVAPEKLISYGLDGIEVYHPRHSEADISKWKHIADAHDLLISGGSDHHGPHSRNPFSIGSQDIPEACKNNWQQKELSK